MRLALRIACMLLAMFVFTAQADVILLDSNSTAADPRQYNNIGPNVLITPHPAWNATGGGDWISYADTGVNGTVIPPDAVLPITLPDPSPATATFYLDFYLPYAYNSGQIRVWADDTARVYVDSTVLFDANPAQGSACVDGPIGCTEQNGETLNLNGLPQGAHRLTFDVYQLAGGPFGLDYTGSITSNAQAPEPATYALLGAGLLLIPIFRRARKPRY